MLTNSRGLSVDPTSHAVGVCSACPLVMCKGWELNVVYVCAERFGLRQLACQGSHLLTSACHIV